MNQSKTNYKANELVESSKVLFTCCLKTNKSGEVVYLNKKLNEKGNIDLSSKVMTTLYIAGDKDNGIDANFIDFAITLNKMKVLLDQNIDLTKLNSKMPVKLRYSIQEYHKQDGSLNIIREITNLAIKNNKNEWQWVLVSKDDKEDTHKGLPF